MTPTADATKVLDAHFVILFCLLDRFINVKYFYVILKRSSLTEEWVNLLQNVS